MPNITFLPATSTIVSTDGGSPVRFTLTNESASKLFLYWIDRSGNEQLYATLGKGQSYGQGTVTSHAWALRTEDGKAVYKFLPVAPGVITLGSDYQPAYMDTSEKIIQTADGLWSTAQGYGLIDVAKSLGVKDVGDLPINGQNNYLALNAINAPSAWAAGITGRGVKVAIIDIGIASNPEVDSKIVGGYDFFDRDNTPQPDAGSFRDHALGAASIIAASHDPRSGRDTMGVAPDAQLLNVRVGSNKTGSAQTTMAEGIRWAADNGAKVMCIPLQNSAFGNDQALVDAVHYAYQKNVVVVIIGGNYSNYGPTGPALIAQQLKGEVIDVGNFNALAGAPFDSSNMPGQSPFPWVMASSSGYVPNGDGGYTYWQDGGTSFAGPYVAGLAALLWEQNPTATAGDIIKKILAGASLVGTPPDWSGAANGITQADLNKAVTNAIAATKAADALAAAADAAIAKAAAEAALAKAVQDALATAAKNQPDVHVASGKNFKFSNSIKNDLYVGIDGTDTVIYNGARADFAVAAEGDHFVVTAKAGGAIDRLYNIDRLQFNDASVSLDVSADGVGGEVYRLYQAAFNRTPDKTGVGFWMNAMDKGWTLEQVADGFVKSNEFLKLYGAAPTNQQLVTAMYANVLHRAPDQSGLKFWIDAMNTGTSAAVLLTSFSESTENQVAIAKIIGQGFDFTPVQG